MAPAAAACWVLHVTLPRFLCIRGDAALDRPATRENRHARRPSAGHWAIGSPTDQWPEEHKKLALVIEPARVPGELLKIWDLAARAIARVQQPREGQGLTTFCRKRLGPIGGTIPAPGARPTQRLNSLALERRMNKIYSSNKLFRRAPWNCSF